MRSQVIKVLFESLAEKETARWLQEELPWPDQRVHYKAATKTSSVPIFAARFTRRFVNASWPLDKSTATPNITFWNSMSSCFAAESNFLKFNRWVSSCLKLVEMSWTSVLEITHDDGTSRWSKEAVKVNPNTESLPFSTHAAALLKLMKRRPVAPGCGENDLKCHGGFRFQCVTIRLRIHSMSLE